MKVPLVFVKWLEGLLLDHSSNPKSDAVVVRSESVALMLIVYLRLLGGDTRYTFDRMSPIPD